MNENVGVLEQILMKGKQSLRVPVLAVPVAMVSTNR